MIENPTVLDSGTRDRLAAIYNYYSQQDGFPMDYSEETAGTIKDMLRIPSVIGAFLLDHPRRVDGEMLIAWQHVYSRTASDVIIDLTASQFNRWLNTRLPKGVLVVTKESPLYRRYVEKEMLYSTNRSK